MFSQKPLVDARQAAFARLASRILETLNSAVDKRCNDGDTRSNISNKIGCNRSQLTRVLNGNVKNITIRTISDILWATDFDPRDFEADPIEDISSNCPSHAHHEQEYVRLFTPKTYSVNLCPLVNTGWGKSTSIRDVSIEHVAS